MQNANWAVNEGHEGYFGIFLMVFTQNSTDEKRRL